MSSLTLIVDGNSSIVTVPEEVINEGESFFAKLDADMDQGWKVGPEYIENPDQETRLKIVADRLMAAIESGKSGLADLLAGYIVIRDPSVQAIRLDLSGDPLNTELIKNN